MGSSTCVVGGVEQVVERGRLEIAGVVVFHGLEVQFSRLSHAPVPTTEAVAQHGAGHVGAVTGMLVGGRTVSDDVVGADHSGAEITVVLVKACVSHGHDLTRPVKVGGEVGRHGVGLHVVASLIVEGGKGRVSAQLHHRRLHQDLFEGEVTQMTFVSTVVPLPRFIHGLTGHVLEGLHEAPPIAVQKIDLVQRSKVVSPSVQSKEARLQRLFALDQQHEVEQRVLKQHAQRHGVRGEQGRMGLGVLQGQRRALEKQAGRGHKFTHGQPFDVVEFKTHIVKASLVGDQDEEEVKPRFEQGRRNGPIQGQPVDVKGSEGSDGQRVTLFVLKGVVHDAHGVKIDVLLDIKAHPFGRKVGRGRCLGDGRKQHAVGRDQEQENQGEGGLALKSSCHGPASLFGSLSVRPARLILN